MLYDFSQLISEPTHILQNSSPYIDLIFTGQPNLKINSGIKSSLHESCHHQITYAKFNLQIIYPAPYQRLVWDYENANASSIQRALNMIDWNKLLSNANAENQVNILNDTLFNIFSSFGRSKVITINDRDPTWINEEIKCKIKFKNKTFQQYLKNKRKITDFEIVDKEAAELSEMIQNRKERLFYDLSVKLNNPQTSPRTHWPIIKSCYNGKKNSNNSAPFSEWKNLQTLKKKPIFLTNIFRLDAILYQTTVSYQKIRQKYYITETKLFVFQY